MEEKTKPYTKEEREVANARIRDLAGRRDDLSEDEVDEFKKVQEDWMADTMRRAGKITAIRNGHVRFTPAKKKRKKNKRTCKGKK